MLKATYSPEDNKLRLYPVTRLGSETYGQLKAAGFRWAPRQELFVTPMWTPEREDLLISLCGEIDDEDTSLVDRAEERADRFEGYSERRAKDAESAHSAVKAVADNIPFGQPILVGHHSERRARKDAERIENGMRKAVSMWETSKYWQQRAAGALAHAKYKERPDVRHRRIRRIEADKRKSEKNLKECNALLNFWTQEDITKDEALKILSCLDRGGVVLSDGERSWCGWSALDREQVTVAEIRSQRLKGLPRSIEYHQRWINHYKNRLAYERAMLGENDPINKWENIEIGGRVLVGNTWVTVIRINKSSGAISSLTTNRRFLAKIGIEEVKDYQAPTQEQTATVKAATSKAPICNYPGAVSWRNRYTGEIVGPVETMPLTKAEWAGIYKDYKGTLTAADGSHRFRFIIRAGKWCPVYLADQKRTDPPQVEAIENPPKIQAPECNLDAVPHYTCQPQEPTRFEQLKGQLKLGVEVVAVSQLFETPDMVADEMVAHLEIETGHSLLDPEAGTGRLLFAVRRAGVAAVQTAVEINSRLVDRLRLNFDEVYSADFLTWENSRRFDRIIMNPPFENGVDIKHILRAKDMLAEKGILVALCANGPRQIEQLKPLSCFWKELPQGSFEKQGTMVNVALLVIKNDR